MSSFDTIAAISTPPGVGAISVVRLSGNAAKSILSKVWISEGVFVDNMQTHRLYYGKFGRLSTGAHATDHVLAVFMKAPHSYTGEDMVEIHCHGGQTASRLILETLLSEGARLADAGEFTRRAFLNGKIDLAQAEAVADMIHSTSAEGLKRAEEQLSSRLSTAISEMMRRATTVRMTLEAAIDFPDEQIAILSEEEVVESLTTLLADIRQLLATYTEGRLFRLGAKVVLAGRPNVGKSSLLNTLLGNDRAIVHHSAGTTRDTIEEGVLIGGVPIRLIDTAGLRSGAEEVEAVGIGKTRREMESADWVVFILDGSEKLTAEDREIWKSIVEDNVIVAVNKTDVALPLSVAIVRELVGEECPVEFISARTGEGLDHFKQAIIRHLVGNRSGDANGITISHARHKNLLESAEQATAQALLELNQNMSSDIVAVSIQNVMALLGQIVGTTTVDEMLNSIFSDFCVGK